MTIKAQDVKELRDKTGLGMMECKKALEEANGNLEEAIKNLRKSSALKAEKKASRTAVEGIITSKISDKEITFVEVNCETDFVAKDENFINFCEEALKVAVDTPSKENLLDEVSESMEKQRMSLVQKIGENIIIRKVKKITKTPVVAIGGINSENYKNLLLNKANFLAISGYIWNNNKLKPKEAIKTLK